MASNELIRAFESYKTYYDNHGADEALINACVEAAKTAFFILLYKLLLISGIKNNRYF